MATATPSVAATAAMGGSLASLEAAMRAVLREGTIVGAAVAVVVALVVYVTRCCLWVWRTRRNLRVAEGRMASVEALHERAKVAAYIHDERCRVYRNAVYDNIHLPGFVAYEEEEVRRVRWARSCCCCRCRTLAGAGLCALLAHPPTQSPCRRLPTFQEPLDEVRLAPRA